MNFDIRLCEDATMREHSEALRQTQCDQSEPIDRLEAPQTFFNSVLGPGDVDPSTKHYTSLKHFKVLQNRHNPIKRD